MKEQGFAPDMTPKGLQAFLLKVLPQITKSFMQDGMGLSSAMTTWTFSEHAICEAASAIMSSMALSAASGDHKTGSELLTQMILATIQKQQRMATGTSQSLLVNTTTGQTIRVDGNQKGGVQ
jgi:hypothetical protein